MAFQERNLSGSPDGKTRFNKYFDNVRLVADYYARGGAKYLRDHDLRDLDFSGLKLVSKWKTFSNFEDFSKKAHELNWILIRGKHYPLEDILDFS